VYAISQKKVLEYTPDLYDAFLTFDNGTKFRVKGGWIKRVDGLVEFTLSFSGSEGTLDYIKLPGFGQVEGWRANVREQITTEELLSHQENLQRREIPVRALSPSAKYLALDGGRPRTQAESRSLCIAWGLVAPGAMFRGCCARGYSDSLFVARLWTAAHKH